LTLTEDLDREEEQVVRANLTCTFNGEKLTKAVTLDVLDVDDNDPFVVQRELFVIGDRLQSVSVTQVADEMVTISS